MSPWQSSPFRGDCYSDFYNHILVSTCFWASCQWNYTVSPFWILLLSCNPKYILKLRKRFLDFLMVQWLRLHAPNAGDPSPIPGQKTRSHRLQLRVCMPQLKILHVPAKTQCNQIKFFFISFKIINLKINLKKISWRLLLKIGCEMTKLIHLKPCVG